MNKLDIKSILSWYWIELHNMMYSLVKRTKDFMIDEGVERFAIVLLPRFQLVMKCCCRPESIKAESLIKFINNVDMVHKTIRQLGKTRSKTVLDVPLTFSFSLTCRSMTSSNKSPSFKVCRYFHFSCFFNFGNFFQVKKVKIWGFEGQNVSLWVF